MITNEELDALGESEVQHRLDRGDWCDQEELLLVRAWLRTAAKDRKFQERCVRASVSSALDAKRLAIAGNLIALAALVVAIIALVRD